MGWGHTGKDCTLGDLISAARTSYFRKNVYELKDHVGTLAYASNVEEADETYPADLFHLCCSGKDGEPAESGLESFEADLFEEPVVIDNRVTPFFIVIGPIVVGISSPETARLVVRASVQAVGRNFVGHRDRRQTVSGKGRSPQGASAERRSAA